MEDDSLTITFSSVEATLLASLLGANMLLGIEDPFFGWLTEEIEEAWDQARVALAERRFIEVGPEGRVVMDTAVAALVGTWAFPEASFLVTFTPADGPAQVRSFHLTRSLGVEQAPAAESSCQLTALEDAPAVYRRVLQMLCLTDQEAASGRPATLSEALLTQARGRATEGGVVAAEELLRGAGLEKATARSLAQTLVDPIANGALVALTRRATTWEVAGLGLLEGRNGLWRLRSFTRDEEPWVEATPCTRTQLGEEIRRVMNRVLPKPLPAE